MPDPAYEDDYLASLYDAIEDHGHADEIFYLDRARAGDRVLDIGCGTGAMLHALRDAGHRGRLVGLDPAAAMLARARARTDIEWVGGYLPDAGFVREFDLAYMTGHAFQVLLTDDEVATLLDAVATALDDGGRFAFETRNPSARPWLRWTPDRVTEVVDRDGRTVRRWHEITDVAGELVTFSEYTAVAGEPAPRVSTSTLRFADAEQLDAWLDAAGFDVIERYGDWTGAPVTGAGPEIITVAGVRR